MERCIHKQFNNYAFEKHILTLFQPGFIRGDFTIYIRKKLPTQTKIQRFVFHSVLHKMQPNLAEATNNSKDHTW